jgi:sugar transferase (PEP-CTERM/EpsH1 system associated)
MHAASRSRVLYVTHRVPYPPDKGDRIRNYHLLTWLARHASVDLACLADEDVSDAEVGALKDLVDRVAMVPIRRGSRRMRASWSLATGRTASEGAFRSSALCGLLRRWAGETRYHAILVSASSLVPYLRLAELARTPAVVDFVDVDSQKWLDYADASRGPRAWLYRTEGERLRRLETEATRRARGVILVSAAETNLLRRSCDAANIHTVPNGVDLEGFRPGGVEAESERTCVFVGALDYRPNVDGVCWFCREVWPEICRLRPGAQLRLVGRQPVAAVRRLARVPGIEVVGQVPDVRPYLAEASVVVVPLRLALGIQNKVLEAMAMGKATVASPQSLVGLQGHGSVPVLIASTPSQWVESVTRLMGDMVERRRLGEEGRHYVEEFHHWDRALEPLESILGLHQDRGVHWDGQPAADAEVRPS